MNLARPANDSYSLITRARFKRLGRVLIVSAAASAICSCTTVNYDKLDAGSFRGNLVVVWLGEGDGKVGDGKFLFVPDPKNPLKFKRPAGSERATLIQPEIMYTDGGSIPKFAQPFKGLSPWAYAPAYMIHDWLFAAHHCLKKGSQDPAYKPVAEATFQDSIEILGEAIKALVEKGLVKENDVAAGAISFAVGSPIARNLWDGGKCEEVTREDRDRANSIIAGSGDPKSRGFIAGSAGSAVVSTFSF